MLNGAVLTCWICAWTAADRNPPAVPSLQAMAAHRWHLALDRSRYERQLPGLLGGPRSPMTVDLPRPVGP